MANSMLIKNSQFSTMKDKCTLQEQFPLEIWLKIIQGMRSEDIPSVYFSSRFMRSVIRPQRSTFLFGAVLRRVVLYLPYIDTPSEAIKDIKEYQIVETQKTAGQILLVCRLVCKTWSNAVDNIFQDASHHMSLQLEYMDGVPQLPGYLTFGSVNFQQIDELTEFVKHMKCSHLNKARNPFPGRHLSLTLKVTNTTEFEYKHLVEIFLETYGHYIRYFNLTLQTDQSSDYRITMKRVLEFLPKLKVVTVHLMPVGGGQSYLSKFSEEFPHLPSLQYMRASGQHGLSLLQEFVCSNSHVKALFGYDVTYTYRNPNIFYPYLDY